MYLGPLLLVGDTEGSKEYEWEGKRVKETVQKQILLMLAHPFTFFTLIYNMLRTSNWRLLRGFKHFSCFKPETVYFNDILVFIFLYEL